MSISRTTAISTSSTSSCRTNLEECLEALLGFDDVSALLDHLLLLPRLDARSYLSDLIGSITNDTKNKDLESFLDKMQDYQSGVRSVPPMYAIPSSIGNTPSTEKHSGNSSWISEGSKNEFQRNHPRRAQVSGSASTTNTKRMDQATSRAVGSTTTKSNLVLQSKRLNGPETMTKKNVIQPIIGRNSRPSSSSSAAAAANVTTKSSAIQSSSIDDNSTNDRNSKRLVMVRNYQGIRNINRKECGCYGTVHDCYTNCLDCGRIACVEEGCGECFFCGSFVDLDTNHTMDTTSTTSNIVRKSGTTVEREKQQWLQRDREFAQRTVVLDDDQVALPGDSYWLDNQERMKAQAAEDQRRKELHSKKKEIQMSINL